ncbi:MAG: tetratricopeptide repeat protein [Pseudomonadota bacterium]
MPNAFGGRILEYAMRFCISLLALLAAVGPVSAKPIVTSSEETVARICLARHETPARIVEACDSALLEADLTQAQRADFMIARGDGHIWQDQYVEAAASYREATEINPFEVEAWNGLGWALWETDGDQAAYDAFEKSLAIEISVQGLAGKAGTGRRLGAVSNTDARQLLLSALTIDPDYIWAVREVAWSHMDDDQPRIAIEHFNTALDIEPDDINARYGLGRALLAIKETETALEIFNGILADAPDDFPSLVYRIITLRKLERNAHALREAERLISAYPDRVSGYVEKGQALVGLERRAEAIETYADAETLLGPNNTLLYWHADALTIDGRFEEALRVIDRGLGLEGVDYSDHLLRSYIALELKDYTLAREAAEASLSFGIKDPWAYYYIAITQIHGGETEAGLARFEQAVAAGLPSDRVGAFATELISAGQYVEAAQLRLRY